MLSRRATWAFVVALFAAMLLATPARAAFVPPPLEAHVVDTAGRLSAEDVRYLNGRLEQLHRDTGFAIVALVAGALDGASIEEVASKTFQRWQIGDKGNDNGVLVVVSAADRKVRIEAGKGVGGGFTEIESNDIVREVIAPYLRQDRYREAIDQGTMAIGRSLVEATTGGPAHARAEPAPETAPWLLKIGALAAGLAFLVVLVGVSPTFRSMFALLSQTLFVGGRGAGRASGGYRSGGRSGGRGLVR